MKKYQSFLSENFPFLAVKFSIYLNWRVFIMDILEDVSGEHHKFSYVLCMCTR